LRRGAKACYRRGQDLKAEATRDQELIKLLLFGQRAQGLSQGAEGLSQRQEDEELREQWLREIGSEDLGGQGSEGLKGFFSLEDLTSLESSGPEHFQGQEDEGFRAEGVTLNSSAAQLPRSSATQPLNLSIPKPLSSFADFMTLGPLAPQPLSSLNPQSLLEQDPMDVETMLSFGRFLHTVKKDYDKAANLYEAALMADPQKARVLAIRMTGNREEGKLVAKGLRARRSAPKPRYLVPRLAVGKITGDESKSWGAGEV